MIHGESLKALGALEDRVGGCGNSMCGLVLTNRTAGFLLNEHGISTGCRPLTNRGFGVMDIDVLGPLGVRVGG
ncbi:hypothetical protein, partial [Streptomyces sp. NPDC059900]|uniref:hypothetical protein n=1 Tax=Streptomyces sp. NPDC059900 TaxID=3155816 RepID=UPI003D0851F2